MDILLHLDQKTAHELEALAHQRGQKLDVFALETLKNGLAHCHNQQWPQTVLNFQGLPDMPAFESYRSDHKPYCLKTVQLGQPKAALNLDKALQLADTLVSAE